MDRNNRGTNNTFWTIVVAIETVVLQIFEDKRIFVITAVFIVGALVWQATRHARISKRVKGALYREREHQRNSTLHRSDSPLSGDVWEEYHRRERECKDLLMAGVIDSAEYYDRLAELKAYRGH